MLVIDKMLVGGIRFVIDKLMVAVDQELNDDTALREQLLAAQMQVELGEMTQEEFNALEDTVLARIREIRERRGQGNGPIEFGGGSSGEQKTLDASDISGIEASFVADDFHESFEGFDPVEDVSAPAEVVEAPKSKARRKPASAPRARKRRAD